MRVSGPLAAGGNVFAFAWAPDSSRIAYNADQLVDEFIDLFTSRPDGSGNTQVSAVQFNGGVFDFAWAPDGSRIAYRTDQFTDNVFEIFTSGPDGSGNVRISGPLVAGGQVFGFSWAPDSSRIAYLADQLTDNLLELFTSRPDGSGNVRVSGPVTAPGTGLSGSNFAWSPDSAYIAYISHQRSATFELFTARPDGSLNPVVSGPMPTGSNVFNFLWTRDSQRLVYRADQLVQNQAELFSCAPDGGAVNVRISGPLTLGGDVFSFTLP
ncbi:MAG: PD40 domain-containing protein [Burkholderiales bacterium]|nr:PD40 domain-containing protein [Burkholderiales bacterium]